MGGGEGHWPDILDAFRPFLANEYFINVPFSSIAVPDSASGRARGQEHFFVLQCTVGNTTKCTSPIQKRKNVKLEYKH
jgi:hypothetical protein